jgi:hypothetical protein
MWQDKRKREMLKLFMVTAALSRRMHRKRRAASLLARWWHWIRFHEAFMRLRKAVGWA